MWTKCLQNLKKYFDFFCKCFNFRVCDWGCKLFAKASSCIILIMLLMLPTGAHHCLSQSSHPKFKHSFFYLKKSLLFWNTAVHFTMFEIFAFVVVGGMKIFILPHSSATRNYVLHVCLIICLFISQNLFVVATCLLFVWLGVQLLVHSSSSSVSIVITKCFINFVCFFVCVMMLQSNDEPPSWCLV